MKLLVRKSKIDREKLVLIDVSLSIDLLRGWVLIVIGMVWTGNSNREKLVEERFLKPKTTMKYMVNV